MACRFKLRTDDPFGVTNSCRKCDERRRYVQFFKTAAHRVFPADGRNAHVILGQEGTENRLKGLSPAFRVSP